MAPITSEQKREEIKEEGQKITQKAKEEKSFDAWTKALNVSFYLGNYGDALQNAENAISVAKNDLEKAIGLFNKGVILGRQNKNNEEIAVYGKVYEEFRASQNEEIRVWVAMVLVNKGFRLGKLGKSDEAIAVYDKVYEEFNVSQNEEIRAQAAKALYNKGVTLGEQGKSDEEIAVYDKVYEEFRASQNEGIRVWVAIALYNKGVRLGQQGKIREAKEAT